MDALSEVERDVRDLEEHVATQRRRVALLHTVGSEDAQANAREGLLLLVDALEIARRRLRGLRVELGVES